MGYRLLEGAVFYFTGIYMNRQMHTINNLRQHAMSYTRPQARADQAYRLHLRVMLPALYLFVVPQ